MSVWIQLLRVAQQSSVRAAHDASPLRLPLPSFPSRARGTVFQNDAFGPELVADAIGLLEIPGFARGLTGDDGRRDLGFGRPGRSRRGPAEPGFGGLLQKTERLGARP